MSRRAGTDKVANASEGSNAGGGADHPVLVNGGITPRVSQGRPLSAAENNPAGVGRPPRRDPWPASRRRWDPRVDPGRSPHSGGTEPERKAMAQRIGLTPRRDPLGCPQRRFEISLRALYKYRLKRYSPL